MAAALVALLFLFCQGMILRAGQGHPGLARRRASIALIMATGLAEGGGLFLLLAAVAAGLGPRRARPMAVGAGRAWPPRAVLDLAAVLPRA